MKVDINVTLIFAIFCQMCTLFIILAYLKEKYFRLQLKITLISWQN